MLYSDAFLERSKQAIRAALPCWDLSPATDLSLLAISENATYLADDPASGARLVIRLHRPGYHTAPEIQSELAWILDLRSCGIVETPSPVRARDGSLLRPVDDGSGSRFAVAFEHMTGREPNEADDLVGWFRRLGAISARLHRHSRRWPRPDGFIRKTWDFETMLGDTPHWGDWRHGLGLAAAGDGARDVLQRTAACLRRHLDRYGRGTDRFGLVHADLRLANVLVDAERLAVIDFDDCGFSWFMYDFAAAVSFFEDNPIVPDLMDSWVAGYREVEPLGEADAQQIPVFVMLRRMLLTAWIASHAETPTARAMGPAYTDGTVALAERFLTRYG